MLLLRSIVTMVPVALLLRVLPLNAVHYAALAVSFAFMIWFEGYVAFHKRFAPRFASRLEHIIRSPSPYRVTLAPLVCTGLLPLSASDIRNWLRSLLVVAGVVLLIVGSKMLPVPWRPIILVGVMGALSIGVASIMWHSTLVYRAISRRS